VNAPAYPGERIREVVTPEGVPLRFAVALGGDRAGAFLLDVVLILAGTLTLAIPLGWLAARDVLPGDAVLAALTLALFLLRTFYFSFFELVWQGQTPGKRKLRIRAVDARGGPLTAEAILTRNLTRELEVFLPAIAIFAPNALFPGAPVAARLLSLAWMLLFGLLPLLNRDRLRVGDLVAGTMVVRLPDTVLLDDLAAAPGGREARASITFTPAPLEVYGEYELQVLEGVLRGAGDATNEAVRTVAEKVRAKIAWEGPPGNDLAFLRAFYAAQRGRLERGMLFGRRRAHKGDRRT
jgi:uncharacterized RDD family membrane protein YckC